MDYFKINKKDRKTSVFFILVLKYEVKMNILNSVIDKTFEGVDLID